MPNLNNLNNLASGCACLDQLLDRLAHAALEAHDGLCNFSVFVV